MSESAKMLRFPLVLLLICSLFVCTSCKKPKPLSILNKEKVAILELHNKAGLPVDEVQYLTDLVRQAGGRLPSDRYLVLTQENINVLLPPGTEIEDCVGTCAVDTARRMGATWILTGELLKFGGSLRLSLKLHNARTAALKGSSQMKADQAKDLEGKIQGEAVALFAKMDPSLQSLARRLKGGFVFEKIVMPELPTLPQAEDQKGKKTRKKRKNKRLRKLKEPKLKDVGALLSANFGDVDVAGLELYDAALTKEQDKAVSTEAKLKIWQDVLRRVPQAKAVAEDRIQTWSTFLAKEKQRKAQIAQRKKERNLKLLKEYQDLVNTKNKLLESRRQSSEIQKKRVTQRDQDWNKLSRLLGLKNRVVSRKNLF
jgi:hypothetical protein